MNDASPAPPHPGTPPIGAELRTRPLTLAIGACIGAVILTALLFPTGDDTWYQALARPRALLPEFLQAALSLAYYPAMATLLYRAQVHLKGAIRPAAVTLLLGILLLQVAWNPLLVRSESLVAGVAAAGLLAGALVGLAVLVLPRDRTATLVLAPYVLVGIHDLWWAGALLRLNG